MVGPNAGSGYDGDRGIGGSRASVWAWWAEDEGTAGAANGRTGEMKEEEALDSRRGLDDRLRRDAGCGCLAGSQMMHSEWEI